MKSSSLLSVIAAGAFALVVAGSASAQAAAEAPPAPAATQPTLVYVPQVPSPTQLMSIANAQHLTVEKITQSGSQITAVYHYPNGQISTVTYMALPENEAAAVANPEAAPSTTVVYTTRPAPVYYPYGYGGYGPWGWYPPVAIGFGFGYHGRWR